MNKKFIALVITINFILSVIICSYYFIVNNEFEEANSEGVGLTHKGLVDMDGLDELLEKEQTEGKEDKLNERGESKDVTKKSKKVDEESSLNAVEEVESQETDILKGILRGDIYKANNDLTAMWKDSTDKNKKIDAVVSTAKGFAEMNYNVDYRNIECLRNEYLYYFSSSSYAEEWIDNRIDSILDNKIVSQAYFISDKSLVYLDPNSEVRVRGRLFMKYGKETNEGFIKRLKLKSECWYYRDADILLSIAVDNNQWERGCWTYLGCEYLCEYKVCEGV